MEGLSKGLFGIPTGEKANYVTAIGLVSVEEACQCF